MKAWRDGHLMRVIVIARDRELLDKIAAGKVELSCGYTAVVVPEAGLHPTEGTYQARQTQIIHNHLAVVDIARAGPVARLAVPPAMLAPAANEPAGTAAGDSIEKQTRGVLTTKAVAGKKPIGHMVGGKPIYIAADSSGTGGKKDMDELIVNGVPYKVDPNATTVPTAIEQAYTALQTELTQKAARITELEQAAGQTPTNPNPNPTPANPTPANPLNPEGSMASVNPNPGDQNADKNKDKGGAGGGSPAPVIDSAALQAEVKRQLDARFAEETKKSSDAKKTADARAARIADARKVLPDSYVYDGKSDAQILADACTALDKDYKATADALAKSDSADRLHGVLDAKIADTGRSHARSLGLVLGGAVNDAGEGGKKIDADAAHQRMLDKKAGGKRAAGGEAK